MDVIWHYHVTTQLVLVVVEVVQRVHDNLRYFRTSHPAFAHPLVKPTLNFAHQTLRKGPPMLVRDAAR